MYNVYTIMYTHIRFQASDWNCCVKRLFVCTAVHIPYSTYHVKTNPSQMTTLSNIGSSMETNIGSNIVTNIVSSIGSNIGSSIWISLGVV